MSGSGKEDDTVHPGVLLSYGEGLSGSGEAPRDLTPGLPYLQWRKGSPASPPQQCKQRSSRSDTKRQAAPWWWHEWLEGNAAGDKRGPAELKFLENACDYISFIP